MSSTQNKTGKSSRESTSLTPLKTASLLTDLALLDSGSVGAFRRRWDKFYRRYSDAALLKARDELRYFWHRVAPSRPIRRMEDLFQHTNDTEQLEREYEHSTALEHGIRLPQFICEECRGLLWFAVVCRGQ